MRCRGNSLSQNIKVLPLHLNPGIRSNAGDVAFRSGNVLDNPASSDGIPATIGTVDVSFATSDMS